MRTRHAGSDAPPDGSGPRGNLSLRRTAHHTRVLPTKLQVGDRFSDETGEWEVIGRPYTSSARKIASARVWRIDQANRDPHLGRSRARRGETRMNELRPLDRRPALGRPHVGALEFPRRETTLVQMVATDL